MAQFDFYDASRSKQPDYSPWIRGEENRAQAFTAIGALISAALNRRSDREFQGEQNRRAIEAQRSNTLLGIEADRANRAAQSRSYQETQRLRNEGDLAVEQQRGQNALAEEQLRQQRPAQPDMAEMRAARRRAAFEAAARLTDPGSKDWNPIVQTKVTAQEIDPALRSLSAEDLKAKIARETMLPEQQAEKLKSLTTPQAAQYLDEARAMKVQQMLAREFGEDGIDAFHQLYGHIPVGKAGLYKDQYADQARAFENAYPQPKAPKAEETPSNIAKIGGVEVDVSALRGQNLDSLGPREKAMYEAVVDQAIKSAPDYADAKAAQERLDPAPMAALRAKAQDTIAGLFGMTRNPAPAQGQPLTPHEANVLKSEDDDPVVQELVLAKLEGRAPKGIDLAKVPIDVRRKVAERLRQAGKQ